ncbi:hypothetical protein EmuJ_000804600 [Echinococcus multilocularis]|uniref:Uncharacterized protein n=1 Tax=Echinococcus multilocularis TaxID=6211 RepID=A0A068YDT4_ECHMU|nr:hypothetical protein EmuJ_000804600 [Echinococcus multilocularis]
MLRSPSPDCLVLGFCGQSPLLQLPRPCVNGTMVGFLERLVHHTIDAYKTTAYRRYLLTVLIQIFNLAYTFCNYWLFYPVLTKVYGYPN